MTTAPVFSLPDQSGTVRNLADYAGQWLIVYFYPEDDTPGCTTEACNFRDTAAEYAARGITVLGISKDSVESHAKFAEKYHLKFPLLSDPSLRVIKAYGAWGRKKFMGKEYDGIQRSTFLIDPDGMVRKEYQGVTPNGHANQILEDFATVAA